MGILKTGKDPDKKKIAAVLLLFAGYFIMQLQFLADPWFATDELDIMMIGKRIAAGQLLYKDICSQHMPFTYYISAVFVKLGARSVNAQRIAFYLFFSFCWTVLYVRYRKFAGQLTMMLYPVAFCFLTASYSLGTAILSEHIAGIGFVILLLEYMMYVKKRTVGLDNAVFISLAVVFSFGTIFVGIFGVAVIVCGVFLHEVKDAVTQGKKIGTFLLELVKKFWKTALLCTAPFALLLLFYAVTGSLHDFIKLAYTDNRTVYAKYMSGYGGNVLNTVFGIVDTFVNTVTSWLKPENFGVNTAIYLLAFSALILFVAKCFREAEWLLGVTAGVYAVYCGARGLFDYHGTPFVAVVAFMAAYVFEHCVIQNREKWRGYSMTKQFATVAAVLLLGANYFSNFSYFANLTTETQKDADTLVLEAVAGRDETVVQGAFALTQLMNADCLSGYDAVTTPWTWESVGEKQMAELVAEQPKVALYSHDFAVWGYAQSDYAPEFQSYMEENYTHIEGTVYVYVRNDCYEEAQETADAVLQRK